MYEPHLLQQPAYDELLKRLHQLTPSSSAIWGKMDVAQMMAHVTANLELATGSEPTTQAFVGRIFGAMAKRQILTNGLSRNTPTAPRVKISDRRQFQPEKDGLQRQLEHFVNSGEASITGQPHPFFGRLTPNEWARLQYVHMDHHFKQFGV